MSLVYSGRAALRPSPSPLPTRPWESGRWAVLLAPLVLGVCLSPAQATYTQATFNGSDGSGRAAQAIFDVSAPGVLTITLTNTATTGAQVSADVLTGVFFDVSDGSNPYTGIDWDPTSSGHTGTSTATVASGSSVSGARGVTDVRSEFAFGQNFSNGASQYDYGVASSGYGPFGQSARFDTTTNLYGPPSPGGIDYGITTAFDNPANYNGGLSGRPLISNSVVFTFRVTQPLDAAWFSNVFFQYGTAFSEGGFPPPPPPPIPEPSEIATGLLFGGSLIVGLIAGRRRQRRTSVSGLAA